MVCNSWRFIWILPSPVTRIMSSPGSALEIPMAAGRSYPMEATAELEIKRWPGFIT